MLYFLLQHKNRIDCVSHLTNVKFLFECLKILTLAVHKMQQIYRKTALNCLIFILEFFHKEQIHLIWLIPHEYSRKSGGFDDLSIDLFGNCSNKFTHASKTTPIQCVESIFDVVDWPQLRKGLPAWKGVGYLHPLIP